MTHLSFCSYVMCGLYPLTTLSRPYTSHSMFITLSSHTILCCARSCPTLCDPMNCSQLSSSVHESSQARILSGLPFPSPEDLPDPGIEPTSLALQMVSAFQEDSLPTDPPGKPGCLLSYIFLYYIHYNLDKQVLTSNPESFPLY